MNLILLSKDDMDPSAKRAVVTGRRNKHIREFLKPVPGDELCVGLVNGRLGTGRVISTSDSSIEMEISLDRDPPAPVPGTLVLALPRPIVFNRLLCHVACLGIKKIVLINSKRVEKSYWHSPVLKEENIKEQLMLGLEQARDTVVPEVSRGMNFKKFIEDKLPEIIKGTRAFVAHPEGAAGMLPCGVKEKFTIVIGPEGGLLPDEIGAFKKAGCRCVSLGERILRVETAVVAALGRMLE